MQRGSSTLLAVAAVIVVHGGAAVAGAQGQRLTGVAHNLTVDRHSAITFTLAQAGENAYRAEGSFQQYGTLEMVIPR